MRGIHLPIRDEAVRELKAGDSVSISGVLLTGRDAVHKWMIDTFIERTREPTGDDTSVYEQIKPILSQGILYHCGPVVGGIDTGDYRFLAAGPTTSIREEPYQGRVMQHFGIKGVIGKGGMGDSTLAACASGPGVYLHAIGGAASLIAQSVRRVIGVYKLEFGVPEAMWVVEVESFPAVVTMDSHGNSTHKTVASRSEEILNELISQ